MISIVRTTLLCLILTSCDRVVLMASHTEDGTGNCKFFGADPDSRCTTHDILRRLDQEMKPSNDSSSELTGPPDSHEAMNNREIHRKVREKRSYEFLMGLINNNSRYEVTRVDPEVTTQKPKIIRERVNASELLLELMVRIASHPDQWDRVHNLLQTIDRDLKTSKDVVTKLQAISNDSNSNSSDIKTNSVVTSTEKSIEEIKSMEKKWPVFDLDESNVQNVNSNLTTVNENKTQNISEKSKSKPSKSAYPKNFTYHRVTGKLDSTSKSPRAYIAVSVIAPKSTRTRNSEEDVALEKELHQLKPWSHVQNLKNMESLRSKWIVQNRKKIKNPGKS